MEVRAHIAALYDNGVLLADTADKVGLSSPAPTCPDWTVRDVVAHLTGVHRWAAWFVRTGQSAPTSDEQDAELFATASDGELVGAYRQAHADLVAALEQADPAVRCWTFLPAPSPLAFWARRQAHETAIHRVDIQNAGTPVTACPPDFAADGIDELFNCFLARRGRRLVADPPRRLAVVATDAQATWTMHLEPDRRRVTAGVDDPDLTITGPASDLYLLVWNRAGLGGLAVEGDTSLLDLWRAHATIRWS